MEGQDKNFAGLKEKLANRWKATKEGAGKAGTYVKDKAVDGGKATMKFAKSDAGKTAGAGLAGAAAGGVGAAALAGRKESAEIKRIKAKGTLTDADKKRIEELQAQAKKKKRRAAAIGAVTTGVITAGATHLLQKKKGGKSKGGSTETLPAVVKK
jgi:hypothetical protein